MKDPLVSILIPNYNSEKFIAQAIASALNQTYKNIEIILVDNGSQDNSWQIIESFALKDNRLKVFRNSGNIGPVKNWKRCLDNATGEYAKFLWSDDYISHSFIEETLPFLLNNNDIGFAFSKTEMFEDITKKTKVKYCIGKTGSYDINQFIYGLLIEGDYPVSPGCGLFRLKDLRKNLIINIPNKIGSDFSQHAIGNDALIYLLTANDYSQFAFINKTLSYFRAHGDSITTSSNTDKLNLLYNIAKSHFVENFIKDKRIIKLFNTKLYISLLNFRNNTLGIKYIADFYMSNKTYSINYSYLIKRIAKKIFKVDALVQATI